MSILMKRALVLIATLTLAGMAVGCDSNKSTLGDDPGLEGSNEYNQEGTLGQEPVDDPAGNLAQEEQAANSELQPPSAMDEPGEDPSLDQPADEFAQADSPYGDDQAGTDDQAPIDDQQPAVAEDQDEMASADEPGDEAEDSRVQSARDTVSTSLGIPASAVIIAPEDRQKIMSATDEFEREARVTASTVEGYLGQVDESALNEEQQTAYQELQTGITTLDEDINQFSMAESDQRDDMKSQIEDHLAKIDENWKSISGEIDFSQSATGGGPEEGMDSNTPDNIDDTPASDESGDQPLDETQTY